MAKSLTGWSRSQTINIVHDLPWVVARNLFIKTYLPASHLESHF
jgi:hypothetical protein